VGRRLASIAASARSPEGIIYLFILFNSNELNSSYAADGYARVKHSLGVSLTMCVYRLPLLNFGSNHQCRFGPGELSAMNGFAGGQPTLGLLPYN